MKRMHAIQNHAIRLAEKTHIGNRMAADFRFRIVMFALFGLLFNLIYAAYNGILGIVSHSYWFLTLFAYYTVLSVMRVSAVLHGRRHQSESHAASELYVLRFSGAMLIVLAVVLSGSIYLSLSQNIAAQYPNTMMITIAAYTFYKITLAIIGAVTVRKRHSLLLSTIRNIGCADAAASVISLQRSMLVSFGNMRADTIHMMNAATGTAVCLGILLLGAGMLLKRKEGSVMAKSKRVNVNEKIASAVTERFQKMTSAVVGGYTKIEDRFVDRYLTRDDESVEDAKARLRREQEDRKTIR